MALSTNASFSLVDGLIETGYAETTTAQVDAFFNRSNGAVVKRSVAYQGDYLQHNYFKLPSSLVSRRVNQATGSDAAATSIALTEADDRAARLARKIGPVDVALGALRARGMDESAASIALGQQIAQAELADQITSAAASLVGALTGTTGAWVDRTVTAVTTKTATYQNLIKGLALMGEAASDIVAWLMPSGSFFNLMENVVNPSATNDLGAAGVVYDGIPGTLGRPVIVSDATSLVPGAHWIIGLRAGAIQISVDDMPIIISERVTGRENLLYRTQGEIDYAVRVLGYQYQTAAGVNPTAATLATTSSWSLDISDLKAGAGFAVKVNAS